MITIVLLLLILYYILLKRHSETSERAGPALGRLQRRIGYQRLTVTAVTATSYRSTDLLFSPTFSRSLSPLDVPCTAKLNGYVGLVCLA